MTITPDALECASILLQGPLILRTRSVVVVHHLWELLPRELLILRHVHNFVVRHAYLLGASLTYSTLHNGGRKTTKMNLRSYRTQELSNLPLNLFSNSRIYPTREPQVLGNTQLEVPLTKGKLQVNDNGYSILCKPPSIELYHRILQPKLITHYRHTQKKLHKFRPALQIVYSRAAYSLTPRSYQVCPLTNPTIGSAEQKHMQNILAQMQPNHEHLHKCNPNYLTPSLHLQFTIPHKFPTRVRYTIPQGLPSTTSAQAQA